MKSFTFIFILSFIFSVFTNELYGQIKLTIRIDTLCACTDAGTQRLEGSFGLYRYLRNDPYSNVSNDTLIRALNYVQEQSLELKPSTYTLIFTPFDSTLSPNTHYFFTYEGMPAIDISCFFFNKNYKPLLAQMNVGDTLSFYSSYFGKTHEEMRIPASQISIVRTWDNYYVAYNNCDYYQHEAILANKRMDLKLRPLTEKEQAFIRQFELEMAGSFITNNLLGEVQAKNRIRLGDKLIQFQSKWSISESLYQRLSQD
ncbi:MAG: Unknown protein [uncultured Aureispira sp.]|uniref:Uncharacterized protein n=1 Tax=uncultured Aureispira sp. TaxID=1331704 RepID=A0A6S6UMC5_9BACT|nr:MAG: Unknown protein [uncultured Aureispira sp.]